MSFKYFSCQTKSLSGVIPFRSNPFDPDVFWRNPSVTNPRSSTRSSLDDKDWSSKFSSRCESLVKPHEMSSETRWRETFNLELKKKRGRSGREETFFNEEEISIKSWFLLKHFTLFAACFMIFNLISLSLLTKTSRKRGNPINYARKPFRLTANGQKFANYNDLMTLVIRPKCAMLTTEKFIHPGAECLTLAGRHPCNNFIHPLCDDLSHVGAWKKKSNVTCLHHLSPLPSIPFLVPV